jgi:hypothetical protein
VTRATFTIAIGLLCSTAAAEQVPVTFASPCECRDNHGKHRWAEKNDLAEPPVDTSAILLRSQDDESGASRARLVNSARKKQD